MYAYKYFTFLFVYLYFYIDTEPSAKLVWRNLLWSLYDYKDKATSSQKDSLTNMTPFACDFNL